MSDFEKAALDEAKRLDISKLPTTTIDSVATDISKKSDKGLKDVPVTVDPVDGKLEGETLKPS